MYYFFKTLSMFKMITHIYTLNLLHCTTLWQLRIYYFILLKGRYLAFLVLFGGGICLNCQTESEAVLLFRDIAFYQVPRYFPLRSIARYDIIIMPHIISMVSNCNCGRVP